MSIDAIHIDSRLEETAAAATEIARRCQALGVGDDTLMMIELSVVEALNNAVEHAYKGEPGHDVWVECHLEGDQLVIEVSNQGEPLAAETLATHTGDFKDPDPDDPSTWEDSGRGLQIILNTMDAVSVCDHDGANCLRMVKRLPKTA
ncbi:MAG: ATP-binding protein [Gammaproteobacteria bacterium]|nr:ATP-binding protein [Gammaproteobacteria bacterium]MCP5136689.1 ATP-binding protein [Gammaproteobacteria bacterium]